MNRIGKSLSWSLTISIFKTKHWSIIGNYIFRWLDMKSFHLSILWIYFLYIMTLGISTFDRRIVNITKEIDWNWIISLVQFCICTTYMIHITWTFSVGNLTHAHTWFPLCPFVTYVILVIYLFKFHQSLSNFYAHIRTANTQLLHGNLKIVWILLNFSKEINPFQKYCIIFWCATRI